MGMRGLRSAVNHIRFIKGNNALVAAFFGIGLFAFGFLGLTQYTDAQAADCSSNSIMRCGANSPQEFKNKCTANAEGDLRAIYGHYRIPCDIKVVEGRSYKDNTVRVNGRVVAKNAESIGRVKKNGDRPISIAGRTYWQAPNSVAFASDGLRTFVALDAKGNFLYAVLADCGNPIYATPVPPPTPPAPKMIQVCDLTTNQIISIKETEFNAQRHSKNLEDCKLIQVCDLTTKKIITIKQNQYDSTKHSKNPDDCKVPNKIIVCDLTTKKVITIDEDAFDVMKHSKTTEDCKEMCPIPGKEHLPVDSKDCVETPPVTPPEETPPVLPETGMSNMVIGGFGAGSMIVSASLYIGSRRDLLSALINR